jgi:putative transposase
MSDAASPPDLADICREDWELARRRFEVIQSLNQLTDRTRAHAKHAAAELGCSLALVYRLLARYAADPRLTSCLPARRGRRQGLLRLPASTEEVVQAAIEELYLTLQRPRVSVLVKEILRRCRTLALPPPSRTAIELRVRRRSAVETTARREGRKAARDRFGRATGSLDAPWPLSLIQIDHTRVDVIVVDSLTRAPIQRPWLTLAIDVCSRCVVGFHLSLEAPSATSVALCLTQAALPKNGWLSARELQGEWPVSGLPERLHLDNAQEFHSEALRRGCEQYGIAVDYRPVRTPHYGGHIERLIGTMMGKVHLLPGTTFSSVADKGDFDPQHSAAMTLEELERWLTTAIVGVYHQETHRSLGTTPLEAWRRGILGDEHRPGRGAPVSVSDPRRFLIDFLPIERRRVRREGVFLHSIGYWSDVLTTWIGERERMIVRYDPRDLSRVYLLGPNGHYYDLTYRDLRRPPISLWEHRLALKRLRDEAHRVVNEDTIFEAIETMRQIVHTATIDTKTIRRQRERRRRWTEPVCGEVIPAHKACPVPQAPLAPHERVFTNIEEWA